MNDDDNENETAPPTAEDEGEVSLPMRLLGVSLSGRRTTLFILRLTLNEIENETAPPTVEDVGEVSLPMRLLGVSLSGRRTTRFILRLTFSVTCAPGSIVIGLS